MDSIFKMAMLLQVVDQVSGPAARIGRSLAGLKKQATDLGPAFDKFRKYGTITAAAGAGIVAAISSTALATVDTQRALGELSSVGIRDLAALEQAGAAFSSKWAGTTKSEFISAAYDIKSGISSLTDTGVAEFTRLAALTGKATKSTTAEMTSLFATGYGIYKGMYKDLTDLQFGEVFSAGIAASVKNFKTTGSGMAQAISSLGAAATVAKRPMAEQLSVLGMLQATMSGSEAGTAYKAVIRDVASAGKKLGLNFYDANNNLKSLPQILTLIHGKFGDLSGIENDVLKNAFTDESHKAIAQLYGKIGNLTGNIKGLSGAMKQGSASTGQMAGTMNRDIGAGIALLGQRWHNLVEVMGNQFLPIVVPVFGWIGNLMSRVSAFAGEHESLTRMVVLGVAALGALLAVGGSLAAMFGAIGLAIPSVIGGFAAVSGAAGWLKTQLFAVVGASKAWIVTQYRSVAASVAAAGGVKAYALSMATGFISSIGAAITAVWSFTAALLANPITWIVVGVVALGAAIYLLYTRFEGVRNVVDAVGRVFVELWGWIKSIGAAIWDALCNPLDFVRGLFQKAETAVSGLLGRFSGAIPVIKSLAKVILSIVFPPLAIAFNWDKVKAGVVALMSWVAAVGPKILEIAKTAFSAIGKGLAWAAMNLTPVGLLAQAFGKVFEFLDGVNLFESGKKIFQTLADGIKSVVKAPVEAVKKGLTFVKNLLPFSDAKEGPLSQLTLSGRRIMETLGAGVSAGAGALKSSVDAAMKPVAAGLAGAAMAMSPIAPPGVADAGVGAGSRANPVIQQTSRQPQGMSSPVAPPVVDAGVGAGPRACPIVQEGNHGGLPLRVETPVVPDVSGMASWSGLPVDAPNVPDVSGMASWKPQGVEAPNLPGLAGSAMWQTQGMSPPVVPDVSGMASWSGLPVDAPNIPDVSGMASWQPRGVASPNIPDVSGKAFWKSTQTEKPGVPVKKESPQSALRNPQSKGVTIQNMTVNLSGVQDAEGFASELQLLVESLDGQ